MRTKQTVLINGAAGGVGTFAVQMAKSIGAEVTGVCSTSNVELVRSIGADDVIDYTHTDFTRNGKRYNVVVDCVGNHPLSAYKKVLEPNGICVIVGAPKHLSTLQLLGYVIQPKLLSRLGTQKYVTFITKANDRDLPAIAELMKDGKVISVIDSRYPLSEAAAAIARVETGHARGKVVITVEAGDDHA